MYSSSYSSLSHLYLNITQPFCMMFPLSLGAIMSLFITLLPLKWTCILTILQKCITHLTETLGVRTTMWIFLWLFLVLLVLWLLPQDQGLVCALLHLRMPLVLSLLRVHMGYLHPDMAFLICSSLRSSFGVEHTALALCVSVLNTLYLADKLWPSQCKYWSMCMGFL